MQIPDHRNGVEVVLLRQWDVINMLSAEAVLHNHFKIKHVSGEWFALKESDLDSIDDLLLQNGCKPSCNDPCNPLESGSLESSEEKGDARGKGNLLPYPGPGYFPQHRDAARRIVGAYQNETKTAHGDRGGENAVIRILSTELVTEPALLAAVKRWAEHAKKTYPPDKRLSAKNFFGGDDPAWESWLNGSPIADDSKAFTGDYNRQQRIAAGIE